MSSWNLDAAVTEFEKSHIERALIYCDGKVEDTARLVGVSRATLYRKMVETGIIKGRRWARMTSIAGLDKAEILDRQLRSGSKSSARLYRETLDAFADSRGTQEVPTR